MRLLMSSEISEGFSCMTAPLCLQCRLERAELRARRAVDDLVADDDLDAADQSIVDADLRLDLASGFLLQTRNHIREMRLSHVERVEALGLDLPSALVAQRPELGVDLAHHVEPAVLGEHAHEFSASPDSFPDRMEMNRPATLAAERFG